MLPFLFLVLALQQAASLCVCHVEEAVSDTVVLANCSGLSPEAHRQRVADVVGMDNQPCTTHVVNFGPLRTSSSASGLSMLAMAEPLDTLFDLPALSTNPARQPVLPDLNALAVRLPLLN